MNLCTTCSKHNTTCPLEGPSERCVEYNPENFTALSADELVAMLESYGLGWSLDHHGALIESRIWYWPYCVGRYRPHKVEPLAAMLLGAYSDYRIHTGAHR